MSSHHIVRENQEPALVILEAHAIPFEKVQELLEWMPTIIVLHSQIETVLGWGIKIDVLLVPAGEETSWAERAKDQQPIEVISFQVSETPLNKVISFLQSRNIPAVNWLASDRQILLVLTDFNGDIEVFIDGTRWSRVKSGRFAKWLPAGTVLQVFPEIFSDKNFFVDQEGILNLQATQPFWVGENL